MVKKKYDHRYIETKWQKIWDENKEFSVEVDLSKPKYYILDMFPYPSGAGLHVGHVTGYTATDILARFKRQKGFNVLHPMGWDSFGLPAEQYAVRTGTHPSVTTKNNINTYRKQLKSLGFSYDWSREVATSDPTYYKWTQWIFTKLYEKGLAYEAEIQVNFCPTLGTVLSNEEVEEGKSKEGGYPIVRKPLKQWILKITAYADELIQDLDTLDWPDYLKQLQRNWIGKSEGAKIKFPLEKHEGYIECFTTTPETIFGITFLVIAPESPLVATLTTKDKASEVHHYLKAIESKSDLDRTDLNKEKSGVFTGSYALHPITGDKIPVWIADYVLMNVGTGSVMGVPSHDQRDYEFVEKFDLPFLQVISPVDDSEVGGCYEGEGYLIHSSHGNCDLNHLTRMEGRKKIIDYLEEEKLGTRCTTYKLRDWLFSRQRYWGEPFPILHYEDGTKRTLGLDELPLTPPTIQDYKPGDDGRSPLAKVKEWVEIIDPKTGKKAYRETNTMPQWAGSCWYYLRFCDPHNTQAAWSPEKENYWMPVDLYVGGVEHAVLHLLYARFWHKVLYDLGLVSTREPFQVLRNQGLVVSKSYKKKEGSYIDPSEVDQEISKGHFVIEQIEKMSKSKLNGVTPDDIIDEFGADSLRLYEMFMGPFDKEKLWNTDAVTGCYRFVSKVYDLCVSEKLSSQDTEEGLKLGHRLVQHVSSDIEKMSFNTAIAKMMEFMNAFTPLSSYPVSVVKMLLQMLYPLAPHIAEECWEIINPHSRLLEAHYPIVNPKYLQDDLVTYVVQVNGKVRARIEASRDLSEKEIFEAAISEDNVKKFLLTSVQKKVFVPNKLLNIVLE